MRSRLIGLCENAYIWENSEYETAWGAGCSSMFCKLSMLVLHCTDYRCTENAPWYGEKTGYVYCDQTDPL